jgi:hypothetical protein
MALKMLIVVFWDVTPCSLAGGYPVTAPEDGDIKVSYHLQNYSITA